MCGGGGWGGGGGDVGGVSVCVFVLLAQHITCIFITGIPNLCVCCWHNIGLVSLLLGYPVCVCVLLTQHSACTFMTGIS